MHGSTAKVMSFPFLDSCGFSISSRPMEFVNSYLHLGLLITACTVGSTSCCISHRPSQWEREIFDPPQLGNPSTDFHET